MRVFIFLLLLNSINISIAFAQNTDSIIAEKHYQKTIEFAVAENTDSANYHFAQCLLYFNNSNLLANWIQAHTKLGKYYRKKLNQRSIALTVLLKVDHDTKLPRQPRNKHEWRNLMKHYIQLGFVYSRKLNDFKAASKYYIKAKDAVNRGNLKKDIYIGKFLYKEYGNIANRLGDYKTSEIMLKKALSVGLSNVGEKYQKLTVDAIVDLGTLYHYMEKHDKARELYAQALSTSVVSNETKGILFDNLVGYYLADENYDSAFIAASNAVNLFSSINEDSKKTDLLGGAYATLAGIHTEIGQYELAEKEYQNSIREYMKSPMQHRREAAKTWNALTDLYISIKKYKKGVKAAQGALDLLIHKYAPQEIYDIPTSSDLTAEFTSITALYKMATCYISMAKAVESEHEEKCYSKAIACHDLIFEIERKLREMHLFPSSELTLLEQSRLRSEKAIRTALDLYALTGEKQYKETAFRFAEKSKSILLLEAMQHSEATQFAGIPDTMLAEEQQLKEAIADTGERIFAANKSGEKNKHIADSLSAQLLQLRENHNALLKNIAKASPEYYNMVYDWDIVSVQEVQKTLLRDQAMIGYFTGAENIYVFVIQKNGFDVITISKDFDLEGSVQNFRNAIEDFYAERLTDKGAALAKLYCDTARHIYQKIVAPLGALPQKLIIVPSGALGYLPFEALLTDAVQRPMAFKSHPYWIQEKEISYAFSATLHNALAHRPNAHCSGYLLGFAPEFDGTHGWSETRHTISGLQEIAEMTGEKADMYYRNSATKEAFLSLAGEYRILHLATHAQANTDAQDFSFIVFANEKNGYDSLYVQRLYNLALKADLVVLGACETAFGKLHLGEGIISLARGFLYAGAKSVLTTLWKVSDAASKNIIVRFYQNLQEGKSKSQSLREAKIAGIEDCSMELEAHPFYWAALIQMGDTAPLRTRASLAKVSLYSGFGGLVLVLIWLLIKRRNKKHIEENVAAA